MGPFSLVFAATGLSIAQLGLLASIYPGVWGVSQLIMGLSDRSEEVAHAPRACGFRRSASSLRRFPASSRLCVRSVLLGLGTAMVYPTLLASIGDVAHPSWRGSAVGVYRLWRDLGYAFGAIIAGVVADTFGLTAAMYVVAILTFLSGSVVAARMSETLHRN